MYPRGHSPFQISKHATGICSMWQQHRSTEVQRGRKINDPGKNRAQMSDGKMSGWFS